MAIKDSEQWHMKKEINLAHVIITISMVVTTMWFFSNLDKRIEVNKMGIAHMEEQRIEDTRRIEKQFDKINVKLDQLLAK